MEQIRNRVTLDNKTRLSWWFPRLPEGIPTPATKIISYDGPNLICLLDKKRPTEFFDLRDEIKEVGDELKWPFFLRTDYLSGKHSWKNTCYISDPSCVGAHVVALTTESAMADMLGFPTDRWIARKLIPTTPAFHAFRGEMPIVKERRYFVQDSKVVCHHPYWPCDAFLLGSVGCEGNNCDDLIDEMNEESDSEIRELSKMSSIVGATLGGAWSIDWLWSEPLKQWFLIDMALADESYHWEGCPNEKD